MRYQRTALILVIVLLLMATACTSQKAVVKRPLQVGMLNFSEQIIIAEMIKLLVEKQSGYSVDLVPNFPGTGMLHKAMLNKELDITVRYTGTDLSGTLQLNDFPKDPAAAHSLLRQEFSLRFQQTVFPPLGFENTYALAVTQPTANRYQLTRTSDLLPYAAQWSLGTDNTWATRPIDGYETFSRAYGLRFRTLQAMDSNLLYNSLRDGRIDAAMVYSTDPRIKLYQLQLLTDDRQFFPPYQAVIIARNEVLTDYSKLPPVLESLTQMLDAASMAELNYQVDELKLPPRQVAHQFLVNKGLLSD